MPRPKPEIARVSVGIRLQPSTLEAIDKARGETLRNPWIEAALIQAAGRKREVVAVATSKPKVAKPKPAPVKVEAICVTDSVRDFSSTNHPYGSPIITVK